MNTAIGRMILALCAALWVGAAAAAAPLSEAQKIQALIHSVETLQGAKFIRNGVSYDAPAAADHLRMKLRHAGARIASADDFITYVASGSSMSGQPYRIQFADGRSVTAQEYFRGELKRLQGSAPSPPAATRK
ncbi:MAG: DUF5329 domain-containing protein [Proteobacteria bacterium]|nr:DUF5329 domain-containing protein [Pseudomonadota bacterium]MBS0462845.1 DUF5329 domain-containing protein [Pseudomonadota bacterium]